MPIKKGEGILENEAIYLDGICPLFEININFFNSNGKVDEKFISIVTVDLNNNITETLDPMLQALMKINLKYLLEKTVIK